MSLRHGHAGCVRDTQRCRRADAALAISCGHAEDYEGQRRALAWTTSASTSSSKLQSMSSLSLLAFTGRWLVTKMNLQWTIGLRRCVMNGT